MTDEFMTLGTVAEELGCTAATAYYWKRKHPEIPDRRLKMGSKRVHLLTANDAELLRDSIENREVNHNGTSNTTN